MTKDYSNENERFERLADLFYQDTNLLAPGKDWPAVAPCPIPETELWAVWEQWQRWRLTRPLTPRPQTWEEYMTDGYGVVGGDGYPID